MLIQIKKSLEECVARSVSRFLPEQERPPVVLEVPADKGHGDFACNIALQSARVLKKAPLKIAQDILPAIKEGLSADGLAEKIAAVEVKAPGFINFRLSAAAVGAIVQQIFEQGDRYGGCEFGQGRKLQLEFVSANPTGPLSVAHARQAAVGDALGSILSMIGFDVTKEYYVNDEGNQINILGRSIYQRGLDILGEETDFPEDSYQGEYIKDLAQQFMDQKSVHDAEQLKALGQAECCRFGVDALMTIIKQELVDFGVNFDVWSHQSRLAGDPQVISVLAELKDKDLLYEQEGATWFRSTVYGDDKDRVVKKSDGSFTYLAPDIAYHKDKFERGFQQVINIWGPDHHGYILRLKAAVQALGQDASALEVLIVQLATIYRQGKPVSMSTRRGEYISLREVIEEVGVDAARFFFLMRHCNVHLDFDLDLAKQETPENPVYYIQYAHARIHSIVRKARESGLSAHSGEFTALTAAEEMDLMKTLGAFPEVLLTCHAQLDPFPVVNYLLELATSFHRFYDRHRVVDAAFPEISAERLSLIDAVRIVLANGLRLCGVSAPEKM